MIAKPSLLLLTALATSAAAVAAGVEVADPGAGDKTRLGVEIAGDMNARDIAAAKRKRALDLREQAARAAEKRMKAELQPAAAIGAPAASAAAGAPGAPGTPAPDESYDSLARIYQAMKPAAAAVVFEQLDMDVQMKVAAHMRDRATGMILAAMTPKGAAALTMALARQKASAGRAVMLASAAPAGVAAVPGPVAPAGPAR
jgi:flagellar motility protein MotE (MotC chaperone)